MVEGVGGAGLVGRVVLVSDGRPLRGAYVSVNPNDARSSATVDSTGVFKISGLAPGRYRLSVRSIGYPEVADSIVLGRDGLRVLVAVAQPIRGLVGIDCRDST